MKRFLIVGVLFVLGGGVTRAQDMALSQIVIDGEGWKKQDGLSFESSGSADTSAGFMIVGHIVGSGEACISIPQALQGVAENGPQAEALMGSPRVTYDVDLCYRRTPENLERLARARVCAASNALPFVSRRDWQSRPFPDRSWLRTLFPFSAASGRRNHPEISSD